MEGSEFKACFCSDSSKIRGGYFIPWRITCLHFVLLTVHKSLHKDHSSFHSNTTYSFAIFLNFFLGFFPTDLYFICKFKNLSMSFYFSEVRLS